MYINEVHGKGGISAKVVAASVANDVPLYTLQTRAPKFLDAEFEKHRVISSNSSSDRAIPFLKMVEKPVYLPADIRLNQAGMQGTEVMSTDEVAHFHDELIKIHGHTVEILKQWNHVHKQHLNRYLLGFSWQDKVVTATEWDNFFALRLHTAADPAMQELARVMKECIDKTMPVTLRPGDWHTPYFGNGHCQARIAEKDMSPIKMSVARCARVSYLNHDNSNPDEAKDIALHDMLLSMQHMSPFEHVATPLNHSLLMSEWPKGVTHVDRKRQWWSGNIRGWIQYRQTV